MTYVTSHSQGGCCGGAQNAQRNDEWNVDARLDASAVIRATLPVPANESCCSSRVAGDEVAGAERAIAVIEVVGDAGAALRRSAAAATRRRAT